MDIETKISLFRGIVGESALQITDDQIKDLINTIGEEDTELAAAIFVSSPEIVDHTPVTAATTAPNTNVTGKDNNNNNNNNNNNAGGRAPVVANRDTVFPMARPVPTLPKKPQQYYVGGSSSGQAVFDPVYREGGDKNNNNNNNNNNNDDDEDDDEDDDVKRLFKKARKIGATEAAGMQSNTVVSFSGYGRRLGHTEGPSPTIQPVRKAERTIKMVFYKNGFIIGDETRLRSMSDEEGREFINTIQNGLVPREISDRYPNTAITVALEDRGSELYTPPAYTPFAGDAHRLTSSAAAQATRAPDNNNNNNNNNNIAHPSSFTFNPNEPIGRVVFQTPDGRRAERDVNPDRHTVSDLRFLATQIMPGCISLNRVELVVRERPPRTLTDYTLTVNEAKCNRALIIIHILPK